MARGAVRRRRCRQRRQHRPEARPRRPPWSLCPLVYLWGTAGHTNSAPAAAPRVQRRRARLQRPKNGWAGKVEEREWAVGHLLATRRDERMLESTNGERARMRPWVRCSAAHVRESAAAGTLQPHLSGAAVIQLDHASRMRSAATSPPSFPACRHLLRAKRTRSQYLSAGGSSRRGSPWGRVRRQGSPAQSG